VTVLTGFRTGALTGTGALADALTVTFTVTVGAGRRLWRALAVLSSAGIAIAGISARQSVASAVTNPFVSGRIWTLLRWLGLGCGTCRVITP